jgi:hypothetical protein
MRMPALAITGTLLVAAALVGSAAIAHAQARRGPAQGYVTADSRYSGSSVSAPVRTGPAGRLEVRLPGGTWLECGRSCSDTLRRETVDFWYDRADQRRANGPGYLTFGF